MNEIAMLITALGVLAFLVSVITQVTKEIGVLKKIHTSLQVTVLSVVLTVVAYFAYVSYSGIAIIWYMVVGAVIAGFIVAFVSMFGWEKLYELYNRFKRKE
ncbi:MAG: ribonuclease [Acutalibacteraceae bacterium]|nr:ribonuclease [Acutalibacteraceae bacterium]